MSRTLLLLVSVFCAIFTVCFAIGNDQDSHDCLASAGYMWCARTKSCVRPWELATQQNIQNSQESVDLFCAYSTDMGNDPDQHGCIKSAGYSWCQKEEKCVRPWELVKAKNLSLNDESFDLYCTSSSSSSNNNIGDETDANNCITSAGYLWCARENKCVRPWVLAKQKSLSYEASVVALYCASSPSTSNNDFCIVSAGYSWCQKEGKCVRPWELGQQKNIKFTAQSFATYCSSSSDIEGADKDANGCLISAGYSWCQREGKCVRPWELGTEKNIKFTTQSFALYCASSSSSSSAVTVGDKDANGCLISAGYSWCQREGKCVRPWELGKEQNIKFTPETFALYCASSSSAVEGGDKDANGCLISAGYSWCQRLNQCVRPWVLAKAQNIDSSPESIASFCNTPATPKGGDNNGCIASAGYSWCQKVNQCVRPWELGKQQNIKFTPETFASYCAGASSTVEGGETDEHGCLVAAGYSWCQKVNQCVRPWELAKEQNIGFSSEEFDAYCNAEGGETDEHGCLVAAGYMWCSRENECVRPWQLASLKNIEFTRAAVSEYCSSSSSVEGADKDSNGCIASAGYSWCQKEGKCVRPWELGKQQNIKFTPDTFAAYCAGSSTVEGGETDEHDCLVAAGYSWCQREGKCVRPWELATQVGQEDINTENGFVAYCESMIV